MVADPFWPKENPTALENNNAKTIANILGGGAARFLSETKKENYCKRDDLVVIKRIEGGFLVI